MELTKNDKKNRSEPSFDIHWLEPITKMTEEQKELSEYVIDDIALLREDFGGDNFLDSRIRNATSILNKLLIEGNLLKAWRFNIGKLSHPVITAPRLEYFMNVDPSRAIINAVAGGAHLGGIYHALGITNKGSIPIEPPANTNPIAHKFKMSAYLEATSLILDGVAISRFNLIKYVANKAGGKHIDFKLKDKKEFIALKNGKDYFNYFGKNAINIELQSIIQLLISAEDINYLEERIRKNLK